jgi:hypothetical protein
MAWQCGGLTAGGLQRADQGPLGWLWAGWTSPIARRIYSHSIWPGGGALNAAD